MTEPAREHPFRAVASDYRRYRATGGGSPLGVVMMTQGFWASGVFRVGHALLYERRIPLIRPVLRAGFLLAGKFVEVLTGISLPFECAIGEGLYIGHFGPIIVNPRARIGRNCNLSQGVTLGLAGRGEARGCPTLGDRVHVGANAILLGAVTIGDDAAIGAGAVVTKSVPPRGVAVGNPARVISLAGSFDFVRYDGMERDEARLASLALARASAPCDAGPRAEPDPVSYAPPARTPGTPRGPRPEARRS